MVLLMAITEHLQAEVSVGEVMSCPNRLGTSNAAGPDGIPPSSYRNAAPNHPRFVHDLQPITPYFTVEYSTVLQ